MTTATLTTAFVLGLLYGRKAKPLEVQVPPKIVYIPLAVAESSAGSLNLNLEERLRSLSIPEALLDAVVRAAEEMYSAIREHEECIQLLFKASVALNEQRISPSTYRIITRRYLTRMVELERAIGEKKDVLANVIREASRQLTAPSTPSKIGSS